MTFAPKYAIIIPKKIKNHTHYFSKLLTLRNKCGIIAYKGGIRVDKIKRHAELSVYNHEVYLKKNQDYGDSFGKTYKSLGIISAVTRISDKYSRLVSLATKENRQVEDESIKDTLLDMANYCLMTVIELEDEENRTNNNT